MKPKSCESALTAIKQVPALHRQVCKRLGRVNLDIGGGPYGDATKYLAGRCGSQNIVHDPCHGKVAPAGTKADTVTIANTLNVVRSPAERQKLLRQARNRLKQGGTAYISVYEGNGSCQGSDTSRGHQRNCRLGSYERMVQKVFGNVERRGKMLIARRHK